jgi:HK97 family phage portal protein
MAGRLAGAAVAVDSAVKSFALVFTARASYGYQMLLGRTRFDYQADVGDPTRNSIVEAVIGWVARNFPEAPVEVLNITGLQPVSVPASDTGAGAMLRLLERPNPWYSGVLLWMATVVDIFARGNGYWIKQRAGAGPFPDRVVGLWWVPSWMMEPKWPDDGRVFIGWYEYIVDGYPYRIAVEDVVHFRYGMDPQNPRKGRSRLASLFREIYTDDEAANMTAALMSNLGVPGVIIAPANTAGATARITEPEKVKQKFVETFGGDGRGQPMVLTAATDIKVLSWSPQQMDLRALRRIPEERISAVLGVSAIVAGLGAGLDRSTFSNFAEARKAAYQESIVPLQRLAAAELEVQLLDDFADITAYDVGFDLTNVTALQEDWNAIWRRAESAATRGLITVQDFQRATGQPVDPGPEVYLRAGTSFEVPKSDTGAEGAAEATLALNARNDAKVAYMLAAGGAATNGHAGGQQ